MEGMNHRNSSVSSEKWHWTLDFTSLHTSKWCHSGSRHYHILESAKTLLHEASLPPVFRSFVCHYAVYLFNRLPAPILNNKSPYKKLFGRSLNYIALRDLGCLCYPWFKPYTKNKLEPQSTPCVYLGISKIHHAHICFDPVQSKKFVCRGVQFSKNKFVWKSVHSILEELHC